MFNFFRVLLFITIFAVGLLLLVYDKLTGTEFVTFSTAIALFSVFFLYVDKIAEFSIAGNIIKLKEENQKAKEYIEQLKNISRISMRAQFNQFGTMHDSSEEAALIEARKFVEFYRAYNDSDFSGDKAIALKLPSVAESVTRKFLVGTALFIKAQHTYADLHPIPTPENVNKHHNSKASGSEYFVFYRDELYPIFCELSKKEGIFKASNVDLSIV